MLSQSAVINPTTGHITTPKPQRVRLQHQSYLRVFLRGNMATIDGRVNGKRATYRTTGIKCKPGTLDPKTFTIAGDPDATNKLQAFKADFYRIVREREIMGKSLDPTLILDMAFGLRGHDETGVSVIEAILKYGERQAKRSQAGIVTERSAKAARRYTALLIEFIKKHPDYGPGTTFNALKPALADDLILWFRSRPYSYAPNYVNKLYAWMKAIIVYAVAHEWASRNAIAHTKFPRVRYEVQNLTVAQIAAIEQISLADGACTICRDVFVWQSCTGMRYGDVLTLNASDLVTIDGVRCISKKAGKTGKTFCVPLFPAAAAILDKYANHPTVRLTGLLLPAYSNAMMNRWLKVIGPAANINMTLTSHVGRKSLTSYLESYEFTLDEMALCLGHSRTSMTEQYYHKKRFDPVINRFKLIFPDSNATDNQQAA